MKFKIGIALFTICSVFAFAPANAQTDAKAKAILEKVSKKINSLNTMKANFAFSLKAPNGTVRETRKGTFYLKGAKYRVDLGSQVLICDNKTMWTYMKDAKEVQVTDYNPDEASISPAKLFTNFYDKEYNYKYAGEKKVNGKTCDIIEMTPKGASKGVKKIELAFDKSSVIVGGNIFEKNGNQYVYSVSGFTANPTVADSYFTWEKAKNPGVEVVDLR